MFKLLRLLCGHAHPSAPWTPRQAAKRLAEAEESGASIVLALLRTSVASKSIRVIELFNTLDTSKDGLLSRWGAMTRQEGRGG